MKEPIAVPVGRLDCGSVDGAGGCDVVVVGSANLDVVLDVEALARPGETVLARGRADGPGGKGLNQAVAAARAGARTALVAAVGDDAPGELLRAHLRRAGVDVGCVRVVPGATGTAFVSVDLAGENSIVVDPGANARLAGLDDAALHLVGAARALLCQLEVGDAAVGSALVAARGLRVVNAAPARRLPTELLELVDLLVVNEGEARALAGGAASVDAALSALTERVPEVVVTLGARGALVATPHGVVAVPSVPARAVRDTTGAGDVFCGALVAARVRGEDPAASVTTACAAASLSVERPGAAGSAPSLAEVVDRLSEVST